MKGIYCLIVLLTFLISSCDKSMLETPPPKITAEQVKSLIGTSWEIINHSGEHKATLNGISLDLTGNTYFNKFKFIDFLDETTLKSNGFLKKELQFKISGNEIDIVDNERFLITIDGNKMTWYWTTEYYKTQIKNPNYKLENSNIKLIFQKK